MTDWPNEERVPEPLPAGSRFRPPTPPPAPPGCGEGGRWDGDRDQPHTLDRPMVVEELQLALGAARTTAAELDAALQWSDEERCWRLLEGTHLQANLRLLRTRLRWMKAHALLGFGMRLRDLQELKCQILELAERPVAVLELEHRWREPYEQLLSDPQFRPDADEWLINDRRLFLADYALRRRFLPAPLFLHLLFRELTRQLDRPESFFSPEAYRLRVVRPLAALLLAAMDVSYAPRRRRGGSGRRPSRQAWS